MPLFCGRWSDCSTAATFVIASASLPSFEYIVRETLAGNADSFQVTHTLPDHYRGWIPRICRVNSDAFAFIQTGDVPFKLKSRSDIDKIEFLPDYVTVKETSA